MISYKPIKSKQQSILWLLTIIFILSIILMNFSSPAPVMGEQQKWTASTHDKTNFPLVGKHRTVACGDCHHNGVLAGTPRECEACHWYRKKDDRYQLQLGTHCGDCHTPFDWKKLKPNAWSHQAASGYPLQGAHRILDCFQCQKNNSFQQSTSCFSCHEKEYRNFVTHAKKSTSFKSIERVKIELTEKELRGCYYCHTTGYGKPGGFISPEKTPHLKNAGCEVCHGPGEFHVKEKDPSFIKKGLTAEDCEVCHTSERVRAFRYKPLIHGGAH